MEKYCLIGHPLGHSLSPEIHARLFALSGKQASYELCDIPPEELSSRFSELSQYNGFNITIPHKVNIIPYCDELSEGAARYRSVNTVKNGVKKIGCNTDCVGFTKSIEALGASLSSKVLIIGCGGVGRMMATETVFSGGDLTIAALESDLSLAEKAKSEILEKKADAKIKIAVIGGDGLSCNDLGGEKFNLLVNASPVGMFPKTDNMPCKAEVLDCTEYVFDAVYNPRETLLAKTAREKGKKAMTGMAMLVLQAAAAHEIWDGSVYKKEDIDGIIREMENLI